MKINHTRILNAYLSRLTTNDLERILQEHHAWQQVAANHSNAMQLKAQENFNAIVKYSIGNLIQRDIINIEKAILEEVAE
jgi:hypothetical protein